MAITYRCTACGSSNVIADATVRWDVAEQEWIVSGIFDAMTCGDCDKECDHGFPCIETADEEV